MYDKTQFSYAEAMQTGHNDAIAFTLKANEAEASSSF